MKKYFAAFILALTASAVCLNSKNILPGDIQTKFVSVIDGLSSSNVNCIVLDADRRLWVGTDNGFNIINNGYVFPFTQYRLDGDSELSQLGNVNAIAFQGDKAIIASASGLMLFDYTSGSFEEICPDGKHLKVSAIASTEEGVDRYYLFDAASNCLYLSPGGSGELRLIRDFGEHIKYSFGKILIHPSKDETLILADKREGVYSLALNSGKLTKLVPGNEEIVSESCIIDSKGHLWVSKFGKGISSFSLDGSNLAGRRSYNTENSDIPSDYVNWALELSGGQQMAVSTDGGVCVINRKNDLVSSITDQSSWFSTTIFSPDTSVIFAGTRYNGICEIRRTALHFIGHSSDASGFVLPDEVLMSSFSDTEGVLWIGTAGGGLYRFTESDRDIQSYQSTMGNQISSICNLDDKSLLVVSRFKGIQTFNKSNGSFTPFLLECVEDSILDYLDIILSNAADGSIYLYNVNGKCCRLKDGKEESFQLFPENTDEKILQVFPHKYTNVLISKRKVYSMENRNELWARSLFTSDDDIISAVIDDECNILYLTYKGLYRHILSTGETECLLENSVNAMYVSLQFMDGDVWLAGRDRCLYRFSLKNKSMTAFSEEDGILHGNDFFKLSFKTQNACYFSGTEGLAAIAMKDRYEPARASGFGVRCAGLSVDGKPAVTKNGLYVLPKKYINASLLLLVQSPSPLTSAQFQYEVIDKSGHVVSSSQQSNPIITLGRFPSGTYSIRVQTFDSNGWGESQEIMQFHRSDNIFSVSLIVFLLSFLLAALCIHLYTILIKRDQETDQLRNNVSDIKTKENNARADFIVNFAREIRTPLSLIYNPLQDMIKENKDNPSAATRLSDILRQVEKINNWVDLIQPTESPDKASGKLQVELVEIDDCIHLNLDDFRKSASDRGIKISYTPLPSPLFVSVNREIFLSSLGVFVANALVNQAKSLVRITLSTTNLGNVRVSVIDDGRSYPGDYDDLFSSPTKLITESGFSSMGLAAVRSRIESMGGRVSGFRNADQGGSTFYIELPVGNSTHSAITSDVNSSAVSEVGDFENVEQMTEVEDFDTKSQTLLIVDDESDVRAYLSEVYAYKFKEVYTASNGVEGLEIARSKQPNIIVSDVKMPKMNGFEFCKAVKSDIEISHLPFILLTSLSESNSQKIGYKMGADVFIPKPFDVKMLYNAIQTQLRNRYEIKRKYFSSAHPEITQEQTFSAADEAFVIKLNKFINDNIGTPDLNIDMILNEMCVSRSTLFNKMNSIIGVSAARYIKNIRVEKAKELLAKTQMTIFEIAAEVGFTESQYFSTVFKQETGKTPSQYRMESGANQL